MWATKEKLGVSMSMETLWATFDVQSMTRQPTMLADI
jgi:hypothetical protein